MDIERSVFGLIGLVVAIILIVNVALPTFQDVADNKITFDNSNGEELFQMSAFDDLPGGYLITYDYATPSVITSGGQTVNLQAATIICGTDEFLIRFGQRTASSGEGTVPYIQSVGLTPEVLIDDVSLYSRLDLRVYDDYITMTFDGSTKTFEVDSGFAIVDDGAYVMSTANRQSYVTSTTEIYTMALVTLTGGSWNHIMYAHGTIASGLTASIVNSIGAVVSDVAVQTTPIDGYSDVYDLGNITATVAYNSNDTDVSVPIYILPENVSIPKPDGLSDTQVLMLSIIPMIMVVLPVIMAVRLLGGRD